MGRLQIWTEDAGATAREGAKFKDLAGAGEGHVVHGDAGSVNDWNVLDTIEGGGIAS